MGGVYLKFRFDIFASIPERMFGNHVTGVIKRTTLTCAPQRKIEVMTSIESMEDVGSQSEIPPTYFG